MVTGIHLLHNPFLRLPKRRKKKGKKNDIINYILQ